MNYCTLVSREIVVHLHQKRQLPNKRVRPKAPSCANPKGTEVVSCNRSKKTEKKRREVHVCTQHTKLPHASIHNAYSEQQHDEEEALTQINHVADTANGPLSCKSCTNSSTLLIYCPNNSCLSSIDRTSTSKNSSSISIASPECVLACSANAVNDR